MTQGETYCWYTAVCKPRQEAIAEENLVQQAFQVYLPRVQVKRRRRGRWLDAIEVLFPRYIFIRVNPHKRSVASVRSTRGVIGLVRFGGQPAVMPEAVIDSLMQRADEVSGLHQIDAFLFREGELIKLMDGPLAGIEGVFTQHDGAKRAIVLLDLLGKVNRVSVRRDWIASVA